MTTKIFKLPIINSVEDKKKESKTKHKISINGVRNKTINSNNREYSYSPKSTGAFENSRVFSQTFCNIFQKECDWDEDIRNYEKEKKIKWTKRPYIEKMDAAKFKTLDFFYNPITQKYKDFKLEKKLQLEEQKNIRDKIASYYDEELKMSQTYDIINLQDKISVFEKDPNYPKKQQKNLYTKERNPSKQNYNIISNINLSEHHYDKPENRNNLPPGDKKEISEKAHVNMMNKECYKDYDIITNKYIKFDDEKTKINLELNKIKVAKELLTNRNFDPIRCIYFDPNKEREFQEKLNKKSERVKKMKKSNSLFNPFNNQIYDSENLEKEDLNNKKSKLRYSLKPKLEKYYHQIELMKDLRDKKILENKLIYDRFKQFDSRGYNMITLKEGNILYKNTIECKNKNNPWEIIKNGTNKNETITTKGIYKSPYDKTDVNKNCQEYKSIREKILKNLPELKEDKNFRNIKVFQNKKKENKNIDNENPKDDIHSLYKNIFKRTKEEWFSRKINNNFGDRKNSCG